MKTLRFYGANYSIDDWADTLKYRLQFKAGNMTGEFRGYVWEVWKLYRWGVLPKAYREIMNEHRPIYVIFSYETPIAWCGTEGWCVPNVSYSLSTTRHQHVIRYALKHAGITYGTGPEINTRKGKGRSPFGPRSW